MKSITSGYAVRLSSIKGWGSDFLPKALVVVHCENHRASSISRPNGTMTKRRDMQVTIHDVRVHNFTEEDTDLIVSWPGAPTFEELTATKWRKLRAFARAKAVAKK